MNLLISLFLLSADVVCQEPQEEKSCAQEEEKEEDKEDEKEEPEEEEDNEPLRRALPAPFDSVFPSTEYPGPTIGVPNTDPIYPLTESIWDANPCIKKWDIRFYGWTNPSVNVSTSHRSNFPLTYQTVSNSFQLDELVFRIERTPDTVQQDHIDWGFRFTNLYGIDYRFTRAQGIFSQQKSLYGYDPIEFYVQLYFPCFFDGAVLTAGRYISPPDIESQISPSNFLISHSLMFSFDCATQTGLNCAVKLNDFWTVLVGLHAGDDVAPWAKGVHFPTLLAMVRWISCDNNDSIWTGIDSFNGGRFKANHDNLQQFNFTWSHRFCSAFFTLTEAYYIFQRGKFTSSVGAVNYLELKICDAEFISFRTDYLGDYSGQRTRFATQYMSFTLGFTHVFNEICSVRSEGRYEFAFRNKPYDHGTKSNQAALLIDLISRF